MAPPGIEVRGPAVPGATDPDRRRAGVRGRSAAPVRAVRLDLLQRRQERQVELDAGVRPDFLAGDAARSARCRLDRRPGTGRPRRPAGRDHRPGRGQDDDQRPELGRPGLHGRPRGRALADVGQRRRRPGRDRRRDARRRSPSTRPRASRTGSTSGRRRSSSGRAAGTWSSRTCWSTACPISASLFDCRAVPVPLGRRGARARERPVLLPRQARVAPRGAALERGLRPRPGQRSASRAARSGRPSSSRRSSRRSRWTRSCTSCASTPRASTPAAGTTCSARSRSSGRRRTSRRRIARS